MPPRIQALTAPPSGLPPRRPVAGNASYRQSRPTDVVPTAVNVPFPFSASCARSCTEAAPWSAESPSRTNPIRLEFNNAELSRPLREARFPASVRSDFSEAPSVRDVAASVHWSSRLLPAPRWRVAASEPSACGVRTRVPRLGREVPSATTYAGRTVPVVGLMSAVPASGATRSGLTAIAAVSATTSAGSATPRPRASRETTEAPTSPSHMRLRPLPGHTETE